MATRLNASVNFARGDESSLGVSRQVLFLSVEEVVRLLVSQVTLQSVSVEPRPN